MQGEESDQLSFGAELFRIRVRHGFSQAKVADGAGLARGYYSQLENSRRSAPPLQTVLRIARALDVDDIELMNLCANASMERLRCGRKTIDETKLRMTSIYIIKDGHAIEVSAEKQRKILKILKEP